MTTISDLVSKIDLLAEKVDRLIDAVSEKAFCECCKENIDDSVPYAFIGNKFICYPCMKRYHK